MFSLVVRSETRLAGVLFRAATSGTPTPRARAGRPPRTRRRSLRDRERLPGSARAVAPVALGRLEDAAGSGARGPSASPTGAISPMPVMRDGLAHARAGPRRRRARRAASPRPGTRPKDSVELIEGSTSTSEIVKRSGDRLRGHDARRDDAGSGVREQRREPLDDGFARHRPVRAGEHERGSGKRRPHVGERVEQERQSLLLREPPEEEHDRAARDPVARRARPRRQRPVAGGSARAGGSTDLLGAVRERRACGARSPRCT